MDELALIKVYVPEADVLSFADAYELAVMRDEQAAQGFIFSYQEVINAPQGRVS